MSFGSARTDRLLCYPMVGPVEKQYSTLVSVLRAVSTNASAQTDLAQWMQSSFRIRSSFARKVCSVLFLGTALVQRKRNKYVLSEPGREIAASSNVDLFYRIFSRRFLGVDVILQILGRVQPASWDVLRDAWSTWMRSERTEPSSWSKQHLTSQLRFRLDWLRSLGLVDFITGKYYLAKKGSELRRLDLEDGAITQSQREAITHNDIEDKLSLIGAFFQFDVKKRASLNDILPKTSQLRENRQVDSLWVRFVHFGGKLQYPFEVQLSGSIADAIERLEMVANVVQKAVVVTDAQQKEKMLDRLSVKRSALLDKIIFLEPADVDKILEATVIMKSFTDSVFGE